MTHRTTDASGRGWAGRSRAHPPEPQLSGTHGLRRLAAAYGISLLAAILGLPGLAAGLISSNTCRIQGFGCSERLAYGLLVGVVLAMIIQLVMTLHLRLGLALWLWSTVIVAVGAALGLEAWPVLVIGALAAPGVAAWVSEPPNRRRAVLTHWLPRLAGLAAVGGMLLLSAVALR